jgi:hypothetical protein
VIPNASLEGNVGAWNGQQEHEYPSLNKIEVAESAGGAPAAGGPNLFGGWSSLRSKLTTEYAGGQAPKGRAGGAPLAQVPGPRKPDSRTVYG